MRTALVVLRKDLRLELRTLETRPGDGAVRAGHVRDLPLRARTATTIDGQLAAGVLTVTLLFAAMLGINRLFVAEREQGGFDAFLLAPVDRTAMLVAKAAALFLFLVVLEVVAVPGLRRCSCSGPPLGPALPGLILVLVAGQPRAGGDRHARLGDRRPHPGPGPDRSDDLGLPLLDPGADRHRPGASGRCSPPPILGRRRRASGC